MPTTLGFISDVHGDVRALHDALRLLDAMGVRQILCLGDVLDYGIFPDEVMSLLAARSIPTLRGNHDRWCLTNKSVGTNAADLEPASRRFLKTAVPSWSATIEGVRVAAHHARGQLRAALGQGDLDHSPLPASSSGTPKVPGSAFRAPSDLFVHLAVGDGGQKGRVVENSLTEELSRRVS